MGLTKDSRKFIESLHSNRVEFLVVGALAVSFYGFPRYSCDIDFFVRRSRENALRIITALREFGFGCLDIDPDDLSMEDRVIQFGIEPHRIDLMTSISGVSFEEAWESRVRATLDGIEVNVIGHDALIRNKRSTGRAKDLVDVAELTGKSDE